MEVKVLKYYKCKLCGFEFCRAGKVEQCVMCNNKNGLRAMTEKEKEQFIEKHKKNRSE
jgi:hypothetical protein